MLIMLSYLSMFDVYFYTGGSLCYFFISFRHMVAASHTPRTSPGSAATGSFFRAKQHGYSNKWQYFDSFCTSNTDMVKNGA